MFPAVATLVHEMLLPSSAAELEEAQLASVVEGLKVLLVAANWAACKGEGCSGDGGLVLLVDSEFAAFGGLPRATGHAKRRKL